MNKELCKKLKDAGFNQKLGKSDIVITDEGDLENTNDISLIPTLSELIYACGEKFRGIEVGDWLAENKTTIWYAKSKNEDIVEGSTPEEAVANLYLELNKK